MHPALSLCASLFLSIGSAGDAGPEFLSERTTAWSGRTQVVPVRGDVTEAEREYTVNSSDPAVLEVLTSARILAGESIGYLRVRALTDGEATLSVGDATLHVDVRSVPESARVRDVRPRLAGPVPDAAVWGKFQIGLDLFPGEERDIDVRADVILAASTGAEFAPATVLTRDHGLARRMTFEVDADELPAGPVTFVAIYDGSTRSDPLTLRVIRPTDLVGGECEDTLDTPRPEYAGTETPTVGSDPRASGGAFVVHPRPDPAWLAAFEAPADGMYQVMVVARGDFGGGAFPSVGLRIDEEDFPTTAARLVDRRWQRLPVGRPVQLGAGTHTLSVRFLNDLVIANTADRILFLDRYEIALVDDDGSAAVDASMMMSGSMAMGGGGYGGLRIALERSLDGMPVMGRLNIQGNCRWTGDGPAPRVSLLLNGAVHAKQQAAEPMFALDRADLILGANRVQLIARMEDGRYAETPVQTVHMYGDAGGLPARKLHGFSVMDERWDANLEGVLTGREQQIGHRIAALGNEPALLHLPENLSGEFDVLVHVRGPDWPTLVPVDVSVRVGNEVTEGGQAECHGWWRPHEAGTVTLSEGPKTLVVQRGEGAPGARLWLRDVFLRERTGVADRRAPAAEVLYPAPGHSAWHADAVVVRAWDDDRLGTAQLLIDGRPTRTYVDVKHGTGHLVFPLLLRDIVPGEHTLSVRVADLAGNMGESAEVEFTVLAEEPAERGPYARAVHLLNRFAYGVDDESLAAVLTRGERAWLADSLAARGSGDEGAFDFADTHNADNSHHAVTRGAIRHALRTNNPARTRLVFWVENHFSTWIQKVQAAAEWYEHREFSRLGATSFTELLWTSVTSPAMLYYLDQDVSYAGQLNENYAREIMELHTLGVDGGYGQIDVTTLAGLLAGLTLSNEASPSGEGRFLVRQFRYDPSLGDSNTREIIGMRFDGRGAESRFENVRLAVEVLAAHPSTARFIARKLGEHYVAVPAPQQLVDDLATVFTESGGELRAVLLALAEHSAFWDADLPERVTSPFDYGVRLARTTGRPEIEWAVGSYLDRSGMGVYDRATPDGWPEEDEAWVDTNGLTQRWSLVQQVSWAVGDLVPGAMRNPPAGDVERWRQEVIDTAALGLTGWTLGETSNSAALEFLRTAEGKPWERASQTAVLIARLPEANLK